MGDINAPIRYEWKYSWKGRSSHPPKVNLLLKAALEKNVAEMERLFSLGATLDKTDKWTLQSVIYYVADCYPVMECFVRHGYSDRNGNLDELRQCIDNDGYYVSVVARVCHLGKYKPGAYKVMELLCANGFDDFACGPGWPDYYDEYIFEKGIEPAIKILLEHGYCFKDWSRIGREAYERYVLNRSQVRRKSCGLDPLRYSLNDPAMDKLESVPLLFGRGDAIRRNERRKEDYADRVRALREFRKAYGEDRIRRRIAEEERIKEFVTPLIIERARSLRGNGK